MGLDVSHDCWHGAYSAFNRWRNKLAEVAGYEIVTGDDGWTRAKVIESDHLTLANFDGDWQHTPEDPLLILLAHSDCDGHITTRDAPWLADRIEQLIPLLPEEDAPGHIGNWADKTTKFVVGLRAAAQAGENVEFW